MSSFPDADRLRLPVPKLAPGNRGNDRHAPDVAPFPIVPAVTCNDGHHGRKQAVFPGNADAWSLFQLVVMEGNRGILKFQGSAGGEHGKHGLCSPSMIKEGIPLNFRGSSRVQMENLAAHMGSLSIETVHDNMDPGADGNNPAVHQDSGGQVSQMGSLKEGKFPLLAPLLPRGAGRPLYIPGAGALCVFLPVHHRDIMGAGGFELPPQAPVHIGVSAGINEHILPVDGQVDVKLVKMSVSAAQGTALEMQVVAVPMPAGAQAPVPAVFHDGKKLLQFLRLHAFIFHGGLRPQFPHAFKVKTSISGIPQVFVLQ